MTDDVAHLMIEHLKYIRSRVDRTALDIDDLKTRMTSCEEHLGQLALQVAGTNRRLDRLDERVTRIERRLDLAEA